MAKTQSLSLNPTKISGTCGRLMCCLKYEQEAYEDLIKNAPKVSASVVTPFGQGTVIDVNLLRQYVKVRVDEGDSTGLHVVPFVDIGKTVSSVPKAESAPAPSYPSTFIRKEREPEHPKSAPASKPESPKNATPGKQEHAKNGYSGRPEFRKNNNVADQKQEHKQEQNNNKQNPKSPRPISELASEAQKEPEKIIKKKPFKRFIKKREPGDTPNQGAQNTAEGAVNKKPNGNRNRRRRKPKHPEVS